MTLLQLERVVKTYPIEGGVFRRKVGEVRALKGVSLDLPAGTSVGLVGESGSGKTTLGKIVAGHLSPDAGRVAWEGRSSSDIPRARLAGLVQMVFQDPAASLNPKLSVRTQLTEALRARAGIDGEPLPGPEMGRRLEALLKDVGLAAETLGLYPHQFSGGQKQRIAIARALAMKPRCLVADEPVSSLDLSVQAQILNLLLSLRERFSLSLIVISHDLAMVSRLAERIVVMKDGEIVESDETAKVLSSPSHPYSRKLLDAVPAFLK